MLENHGRYDFSAISNRPDYDWPDGKRLAVYIAVNVEAFRYGRGKGAAIAPPDQANSHSVYSWRDYGNRVGVWRLMELFDELGLPAEAQMNTAIYDECPGVAEALRARGDEILGSCRVCDSSRAVGRSDCSGCAAASARRCAAAWRASAGRQNAPPAAGSRPSPFPSTPRAGRRISSPAWPGGHSSRWRFSWPWSLYLRFFTPRRAC